MRSVLLIVCVCAGCARDAMPGVPEQQEGVATKSWLERGPYRIDLLVVIDDSPAMQPYAARLADEIRIEARVLHTLWNPADIQLGVITADVGNERDVSRTPIPGSCGGFGDAAAFRRSPLVDGAFIHERYLTVTDGTNVAGTVEDALAALADVGAGGCVRARPLEAMRIALDHNPHDGGFRRAGVPLAVVIIAAQDDDSPRSLDEYEAFLKRLTPNVTVQIAGGRPLTDSCGEQATDRLYAFQQRFGAFGYLGSICDVGNEWLLGGALANTLPDGNLLIGDPCFDTPLADADPAPGIQPDCTVTEHLDRGTPDEHERLMAACSSGALPCWRIVEDPQCATQQHLRIDVNRGGEDPPDNDVVEAQCVSS